jgi:hypothetical protein
LRHWQQDPDLIGVRDKRPLAWLPVEERLAWHRLWAAVADALTPASNESQSELPADEFLGASVATVSHRLVALESFRCSVSRRDCC